MKKRIGLLYGGKSAEHEVSLSTAWQLQKQLILMYMKYIQSISHTMENGEKGPVLKRRQKQLNSFN